PRARQRPSCRLRPTWRRQCDLPAERAADRTAQRHWAARGRRDSLRAPYTRGAARPIHDLTAGKSGLYPILTVAPLNRWHGPIWPRARQRPSCRLRPTWRRQCDLPAERAADRTAQRHWAARGRRDSLRAPYTRGAARPIHDLTAGKSGLYPILTVAPLNRWHV